MPLEDAHVFLSQLLGTAHSKPAVHTLRSSQDTEGRRRVGVFVADQLVGHLSDDVDGGLLATVQACELNGAVARARGDLTASLDQPGRVTVRVSLADSEYLLCDPPAEAQTAGAPLSTPALDEAAAPEASSGWTDDYPEWPAPRPKPTTIAQPVVYVQTVTPALAPALAPAAPGPAALITEPLGPTGLATRTQAVRQAPQAGWLGSTVQSAQGAPGPTAAGGTATSAGAGTASGLAASAGAGTAATHQSPSWQDLAERASGPGAPDDAVVAAWSTSPPFAPRARPTVQALPASSSKSARTLILSALVVLVVAASAFMTWKVMFAPKTYTDETQGYSFSYPHGWDVLSNGSVPVGVSSLSGTSGPMNLAMAGHGLDSEHPNDVALVEVAWQNTTTAIGAPQLMAELETYYATAQAQGVLRVDEPLSVATLSGLDGFRVGLTLDVQGRSVTSTCYFLIDDAGFYVLLSASTPGLLSESQKAFDRFFDTFKPGDIKK